MAISIGKRPQAAAPKKTPATVSLDNSFDLPDDDVQLEDLDGEPSSAESVVDFSDLYDVAKSSICAGFNSPAENIVEAMEKVGYLTSVESLTRLFQIVALLRNGAKQNKPLQIVGISKPNPTAYSFQSYSPAKTGSPLRIHYKMSDGTQKSAFGSCFAYKVTDKGMAYLVYKENGDFSGVSFDESKGEGPLVIEKLEVSAESDIPGDDVPGDDVNSGDEGDATLLAGLALYETMLTGLAESGFNEGLHEVVYKALLRNISDEEWDEKRLFQGLSSDIMKYSKANLK